MTPSALQIVVEPESSLDPYALRCEQLRSQITALAKLEGGHRHTIPVLAFIATATPPASGRFDLTTTWTAPTSDPALGGALLFATIMTFKTQAPAVYAQFLERMRALDPHFPEPV